MFSTYGKYAASLMIAVMLGISGIASSAVLAEDVHEYTDVKPGESHYEGVQWLSDQGIQGYENGSFGTGEQLTRPHAAIMFTRALDLEIPDAADVTEYFDDVTGDDLYAEFIAATGKSDIFKGSNGNFLPQKKLTREQMASTIVNAYGFESNEKGVDIYLANVSATHQESVQVLADLEITNQLDDFRPNEIVTRGQFATFLHLASEVVLPETVESIEDKHIDMGASLKDLNMPNEVEVTYDDGSTKQLAVNWDYSNLDLTSPGEYEISGNIHGLNLEASAKVIVDEVVVEQFEDITVFSGEEKFNLPQQVEVTYQDDSTKNLDVNWDLSGLDLETAGEYVLTGKITKTNLTATVKVIVQTEFPDAVSLNRTEETLKEDESLQLTAKITPKDAIKKELTWTSSDESIVNVDQTGKITAIAEGTAKITVITENGLEDTVLVKVDNKPSLHTNSYGSVIMNGVIKSVSLGIRNVDSEPVTVEKVEIYEDNNLRTTYTKQDLESNDIDTSIARGQNWGMSINYKIGGLWEGRSHVIYYIKSKHGMYEYKDNL